MSNVYSIFSKLPLAVTPEKLGYNQNIHRRNKLIARLREQREMARCMIEGEQREMARCMIEGEQFELKQERWVTDAETGLRKKVSLPKQVRQWYYQIDGNMYFEICYGNKLLELSKGKTPMGLGDTDKLINVVDTVINAVEFGELDEMLLAGLSLNIR